MHKKLVHIFKYNPRTKRKTKGLVLMGFIKDNKISFQLTYYQVNPFLVVEKRRFSLVCKNGKFNFYSTNYQVIGSPVATIRCKSYNPTFRIRDLKKTHHKRIIVFINKWLKQYKIRIKAEKYENAIIQLCYPTLRDIKNCESLTPEVSFYYKNDFNKFCKIVCGNSGKKTKKLVIELFKTGRFCFPVTVGALSKLLCPEQIHCLLGKEDINLIYRFEGIHNFRITDSNPVVNHKKYTKRIQSVIKDFYSKFTPQRILNLVDRLYILPDVIRFHSQFPNEPLEGSLDQIHNHLSNLYYKKLHEPKDFQIPELFKKMQDKINIKFPENSTVLDKWSSIMHNCVRTYSESLFKQTYWIGFIEDKEINVGWVKEVVQYAPKSGVKEQWKLSQFLGKYNNYPDQDLALKQKLEDLTYELQKT